MAATVPAPSIGSQPPEAAAPLPDLIPQIIPALSINLLAGPPGVGKTALIAWMVYRLRNQLPIFGHQPNPIPAIGFIAADRSWTSTGQWFDAAGFSEILHYSLQDDHQFNPQRLRRKMDRVKILGESIDKLGDLPPGSLVVVDPLALFLGGNLIDYDSCLVACSEIRRLCQQKGISILGTAHSAKQKADKKERYLRLQDRILGSAALFGYSDTQMYLASPDETGEKHYTFLWHPHHALPETFPLGRADNGLFVPWEESIGAEEETGLLALIPTAKEGIGFGELVVLADGVSRASVHRHLQVFCREGRVMKVEHGRYRRPEVN